MDYSSVFMDLLSSSGRQILNSTMNLFSLTRTDAQPKAQTVGCSSVFMDLLSFSGRQNLNCTVNLFLA